MVADRSVSVRLRMIIADYVAPAETATKATDKLAASMRRAGTAQRENAKDIEAAGRQLKTTGAEAKQAGDAAKKGADGLKAAGESAKKAGTDAAKGAQRLKKAGAEAKGAGTDATRAGTQLKAAGRAAETAGTQAARGGQGFSRMSAVAQRGAATTSAAWKRTAATTGTYTRQILAHANKHEHAYNTVGNAATVMGGAVALGFGAAVAATARFDKAMSSVRANSGATGASFEALRRVAIKAGADTAFSATEAAEGENELAKAGVSVRDIVHGGLAGALSLAAAGQISVSEAAETAATAMTQFRLSGSRVPHIADLLSAAANKAQGGVHDMAYALKQSGLVASQFGLSVEDTVGTLSAFASAGLIGSDAGTSFKQMLLQLANPTNKAANLMDDLGISAYDAQGNFVGIANFAGILRDKLAKLTPQQRQSALATIFGSDAIRAANVLYQQGAGGIQQWINRVNDQGNAARTAGQKMNNLAGDLEQLKGSLETALISGGGGATGVLRRLAQGATGAVNAFNRLPPAVQGGITAVGGVVGVTVLAGGALVTFIPRIAETAAALKTMRNSAIGARLSLQALAKGTLVIAGLIALNEAMHGLEDAVTPTPPKVNALATSLVRLAQTGRVSTAFRDEWVKSWGDGTDALEKFDQAARVIGNPGWFDRTIGAWLNNVLDSFPGMTTEFDKLQQKMRQTDGALASLVTSGHAQQAQQAYQYLAQRARQAGVSQDQLIKLFPKYFAATKQSATGSNTAASGLWNAGNAAGAAAGQVNRLTGELSSYYNQIAGDLTSAQLAFARSLKNVGDTFKRNGLAIHGSSIKALENRDAVRAAAQAASDAAQKLFTKIKAEKNEAAATAAANNYIRAKRRALIQEMVQSGLSRAAAKRLVDTWLTVPAKKSTHYSTPGVRNSTNDVHDLGTAIARIHGKRVIINAATKQARAEIGSFYRWFTHLRIHNTATIGFRQLGPGRQAVPFGARYPRADGGITRFRRFADGTERHIAQIARPGDMRVWAEPETQGEAYIPLAPSKRPRSTAILGTVANDFGFNLTPMADGATRKPPAPADATQRATRTTGRGETAQQVAALADAATAADQATATLADTSLPAYRKSAAAVVPATRSATVALKTHTAQTTADTQAARLLAATQAGAGVAAAVKLRANTTALSGEVSRNSAVTAVNTTRERVGRAATQATTAAVAGHTARTRSDTGALQHANSVLATNASRVRAVGREAVTSGKHVDHFVDEYIRRPWKITRHITVNASGKFTMQGFKGFASGGEVDGPGGPRDDRIPALLSDDEHVWTSREVRGAGGHRNVERLRAAAAAGELPRFADGGAVTTRRIPNESVPKFTPDYKAMLDKVVMSAIKTTAAESAAIMRRLFAGGGAVLAAAKSQLGVPYSWGGGGKNGPSYGIAQGRGIRGFDCSGLMEFAYWQGAHYNLPGTDASQIRHGKPVHSRSALRPGDIARPHVGHIYMIATPGAVGPHGIIEAPQTGMRVRLTSFRGMGAGARHILSGGSIGTAGGWHAGPGKSRAFARGALGEMGWGAGQFAPLNSLWNKESSWHYWADNPYSDAYGIPQALPGRKMASAGKDWHDNSFTQIKWGLGYIDDRYHSPAQAWRHSQRTGWYDDGGVAVGSGFMPKSTIKPERVLSPEQTQVFERFVDRLPAATGGISAPEQRRIVAGFGQALLRDLRQMAPHIAIAATPAGGDGAAMVPVINLNHVPGYTTPQEVRRAYGQAVRTARLTRRR